eukprot:m.58934 g.58934  ORF g.58934 m.58934 type:complete len:95 (+) comp34846_c0_seq7:799-1083(+)
MLHVCVWSIFSLAFHTDRFLLHVTKMDSALQFCKGHLIAPVICHAFCNFMGFPDFGRIYELPRKQGALLSVAYVAGAIGFIALLNPLTSPKLFL